MLSALPAAAADAERLELRAEDTICLAGNTFAERLNLYGYFESGLFAAFPDLGLSVRNLAWSADEAALRPRPLDFGTLDRHLEASGADVVLLFYGANESFAGAAGLPAFRNDLGRLLRHMARRSYNGVDEARVALVSPIPQEALPSGRGLDQAAVDRRNADLRAYAEAAGQTAAENDVLYLDIFDAMAGAFAASAEPLTINGAHLNELGYWHAAGALLQALGADPPRSVSGSAGGGAEFELAPPVLPPAPGGAAEALRFRVTDLAPGYYALLRGEEVLASGSASAWAAGVELAPSTATAELELAGEGLLQAVVSKNRLFHDRYRAVNGYYIYGGRKEPFGVHSFPPEMARFDQLVAGLDEEIQGLARTDETWRLERVDE